MTDSKNIRELINEIKNCESSEEQEKKLIELANISDDFYYAHRVRILCLAVYIGLQRRVLMTIKSTFASFSNMAGVAYELNDVNDACIIYRYIRYFEYKNSGNTHFSNRMYKSNLTILQEDFGLREDSERSRIC